MDFAAPLPHTCSTQTKYITALHSIFVGCPTKRINFSTSETADDALYVAFNGIDHILKLYKLLKSTVLYWISTFTSKF